VQTRRLLLSGLLAALASPALAEGMTSSPRPVPRGGRPRADGPDPEALIKAAKLGGTVTYALADAGTGAILESRQPDTALPPASVAKAITALYALDRLGPAHRFTTRALASGAVSGGTLQGDLILAGDGDPTLQTDQLGDLAARIAATGLRRVTGRFLAWDAALPRIARISDDQPDHVGYNATISGLNLNFNRVHFEWKRAGGDWQVAMDARGERFVPPVRMVRASIAPRETPLFTYDQSPGREDWTVASAALGKGGSRWLPVRQPALYTAEVLRTLLAAHGIDLPAPEVIAGPAPQGTEIARAQSEPLTDVLRDMLRFSTNITAEVVGLTASGAASLQASGARMTDWAGATLGLNASFADHSGLGAASRITANGMLGALLAAERQGRGLKPILRSMGMRDEKGKEIKDHPVQVLAKSGTLNFVSGLAGHIVPPATGKWAGRELVFAIFSGDPARRDAIPVSQRESPEGGEGWTKRARALQGQLINRWATLYL
jgi:D-alanyl-D-alanine carboxypeptidase/D-alanyl-D-alanine-endopeptidase (penicillin-binding protein 4)